MENCNNNTVVLQVEGFKLQNPLCYMLSVLH